MLPIFFLFLLDAVGKGYIVSGTELCFVARGIPLRVWIVGLCAITETASIRFAIFLLY